MRIRTCNIYRKSSLYSGSVGQSWEDLHSDAFRWIVLCRCKGSSCDSKMLHAVKPLQIAMYNIGRRDAEQEHHRGIEGWVYAYQMRHDCSFEQVKNTTSPSVHQEKHICANDIGERHVAWIFNYIVKITSALIETRDADYASSSNNRSRCCLLKTNTLTHAYEPVWLQLRNSQDVHWCRSWSCNS